MSITRRALLLAALLAPIAAVAHPGRTDKHGCHKTRRGRRHCHTAQPAPQPPKPRKSPPTKAPPKP